MMLHGWHQPAHKLLLHMQYALHRQGSDDCHPQHRMYWMSVDFFHRAARFRIQIGVIKLFVKGAADVISVS